MEVTKYKAFTVSLCRNYGKARFDKMRNYRALYIYIKNLELRLRSSETRDHHHEDRYVVPRPRCGFLF